MLTGDDNNRYHWAILMGPKDENKQSNGTRFHAKESITGPNASTWLFEERTTSLGATSMLLVRVMVAKIEKRDRCISILRDTPIRQGEVGWNCVGWVQEALLNLEKDGKALGTSLTEWTTVRDTAMEYCQRKRDEHRFDGSSTHDIGMAPTYDLLEKKETIP